MDGVAVALGPAEEAFRDKGGEFRKEGRGMTEMSDKKVPTIGVLRPAGGKSAGDRQLMSEPIPRRTVAFMKEEEVTQFKVVDLDSTSSTAVNDECDRRLSYGSEATLRRTNLCFSRRTSIANSRRSSFASRKSWRRGTRKSTFKAREQKWRLLTWMQSFKVNYEDLTTGEMVGEGSTANVYRGQFQEEVPAEMAGEASSESLDVAIKQFLFDREENAMLAKALVRELEVLTSLQHDNLVRLIGIVEEPPCIVMEFCRGGVLYNLLYSSEYKIHWEQQLKIACDIAEAMDYLHSLEPQIIHRDLKSLNCLLDDPVDNADCEPFVKVADFGMARRWDPFRKLTKCCGTSHWMAPEVAQGVDYEAKADVFSYGMMLWEILCLEVPFQSLQPETASTAISAGKRPELSSGNFATECPEALKTLMTRCWAQEPSTRPDFEEVLDELDGFFPDNSSQAGSESDTS